MNRIEIELSRGGPKRGQVGDRVLEIVALTESSKSLDPEIEASAHVGVATIIQLADIGIDLTKDDISRVSSKILLALRPIMESELKAFREKGGRP